MKKKTILLTVIGAFLLGLSFYLSSSENAKLVNKNCVGNILYLHGCFDLDFPFVFYVNQTIRQLIMSVSDTGIVAVYIYNLQFIFTGSCIHT